MEIKAYLDALKSKQAPMTEIMRALRFELLSLTIESFDKEQTPEGQKWATWIPPYQSGSGKILNDTGKMRNSFNATSRGNQLYISNNRTNDQGKSVAKYHQDGTKKMVARRLLPDKNNLPPEWQTKIEDIVFEIFQEYWAG